MNAGQDTNFRQKVSALTPQERRQKHQWINNFLANLQEKRQSQLAAAINELELTGECNGTDNNQSSPSQLSGI